jgi:hypothetical protein
MIAVLSLVACSKSPVHPEPSGAAGPARVEGHAQTQLEPWEPADLAFKGCEGG